MFDGLPIALTVREAAELARVSVSTMYRAVHAGIVPVISFGNRMWVPRLILERILSGEELPVSGPLWNRGDRSIEGTS
jgi:excisionase family DNA binding protein